MTPTETGTQIVDVLTGITREQLDVLLRILASIFGG